MNRHLIPAWRPGVAARVALGVLVAALVLAANCNDPNGPSDNPAPADLEYSGGWDSGGGTFSFRLESPEGGLSALQLVATNPTWDPASEELHAQVAIRNTGTVELPGPENVVVGSFDPQTVYPINAGPQICPLCPDCPCPWPWAFDHAGTFGDDGVLSPGETSTPIEWVLHVPGGESFSFRALLKKSPAGPRAGVISGSVFTDANRNGHREDSEAGIAGAVISLQHGDTGSSAFTDDNGVFEFEVAEEGLYELVYEPASECNPTTPVVRQVFIVRRPDGTLSGYDHADFGCGGNVPPDSSVVHVVGLVFEDVNRNGAHDPGEPGIPGVRIDGATLQCPTFAPIVAHTDANGRYEMQLPRCEPPYVIHREPLDGFVDTTPNPVVFPGVIINPSVDPNGMPSEPPMPPFRSLRADFGVARIAPNEDAVEGVVFLDSNRNGVRDADEPGLAGVQVTASGSQCMTPVAGVTHTDARGHYVLFQAQVHCPFPWSVAHGPVRGHCDTSPNPLQVPNALPTSLPLVYRADFGVAPCDSLPPPQGFAIDGVVWFDANQDGIRDPDEPGLSGVTLQIVSPCNALWQASTDETGHYAFGPIPCPVRAVVQTRPAYPFHTTPNPHPVDPNAVPADGVLHIDFGVFELRR
jgi:SdrD B-like domain